MRRSIIIDGEASDWYESATFVLKEERQPELPHNLTNYAEDLLERNLKIGNYRERLKQVKVYENTKNGDRVKNNKKRAQLIDMFLVISLCTLGVVLIMYFML